MLARVQPVRGRLERAVISRAGAPVYVDYAHTPDALEAAIAALRPHVKGRLITVFGAGGDRDQRQARRDGRGRGAAVRPGHRHRRQSAQRGPGGDPRATCWPARPARREIGGRREAIAAAIAEARAGRHRPARRQGPRDRARSSATGCCRSTTSRSRGSARHERALDLQPRSPPRPAATRERARSRSTRRHLRQPRGRAGRPVRRAEGRGDRRPSASSTRPSPPAPPARWSSQPVDAAACAGRRHRRGARGARPRGARARAGARIVGVTGSVGKTSTKEALFAALDRGAPRPGAPLGQELQQPYRRAAEPGADAARRATSACSRWA